MQTIDQLFSDYPQKTMNLRQKVDSVSGKSATATVTKTGLKVFLQGDGGDLATGILAGTVHRMFISQSQLGEIVLDFGDELLDGDTVYTIKGLMLEDSSPDVAPFYELECKKN